MTTRLEWTRVTARFLLDKWKRAFGLVVGTALAKRMEDMTGKPESGELQCRDWALSLHSDGADSSSLTTPALAMRA